MHRSDPGSERGATASRTPVVVSKEAFARIHALRASRRFRAAIGVLVGNLSNLPADASLAGGGSAGHLVLRSEHAALSAGLVAGCHWIFSVAPTFFVAAIREDEDPDPDPPGGGVVLPIPIRRAVRAVGFEMDDAVGAEAGGSASRLRGGRPSAPVTGPSAFLLRFLGERYPAGSAFTIDDLATLRAAFILVAFRHSGIEDFLATRRPREDFLAARRPRRTLPPAVPMTRPVEAGNGAFPILMDRGPMGVAAMASASISHRTSLALPAHRNLDIGRLESVRSMLDVLRREACQLITQTSGFVNLDDRAADTSIVMHPRRSAAGCFSKSRSTRLEGETTPSLVRRVGCGPATRDVVSDPDCVGAASSIASPPPRAVSGGSGLRGRPGLPGADVEDLLAEFLERRAMSVSSKSILLKVFPTPIRSRTSGSVADAGSEREPVSWRPQILASGPAPSADRVRVERTDVLSTT